MKTGRCPDCSQEILPGRGIANYAILRYNRDIEEAMLAAVSSRPGQPTCGLCDAPAAWTCNTCKVKHFCAECSSAVRREGPASAHALSAWDGTAAPVMCSVHPQFECTRFCKQDKRAVCYQCIFYDHKGHETVEIDEASSLCTHRIQNLVAALEDATVSARAVHEKWCQEHVALTGCPFEEAEKASAASGGGRTVTVIAETVESIRRHFDLVRAQLWARQGDRKTAHVRERENAAAQAIAESNSVRATR